MKKRAEEMTSFQRRNPYNRFLPYASSIDEDADKLLAEIKDRLPGCVEEDNPRRLNTDRLNKWVFSLHNYVILYGQRFTLEDHVFFAETMYMVFTLSENVDPLTLERVGTVLVYLLKKKYLLEKKLVLDWKPLFDLYYYYEDSSLAVRGLVKPQAGLKSQIKVIIKYARSYFSPESTQEMLDLWRPLLCPYDRSMSNGMKYLATFLPTTTSVDPDKGWKLWFDELMDMWLAFGNSPSWEFELFQLYARLAYHNTGRIDWGPHVEPLFTRFMVAFCLPVTYGQSGIKVKFGLSDIASIPFIGRWIVAAMGGQEGQVVQDHLDKMLLAIESYYHPANANSASEGLHLFIAHLCSCYVFRVHLERYNDKWESKTPVDKRLTDEDISRFVQSLLPIVFHVLYNPYDEERKNIFNILSTLRPSMVLPPLLEKLHVASETLTEPHRLTACVAALSACSRPLVEHYPLEVFGVITALLPGIDINDIWKSTDIFILLSDLLEMIWLVDFSRSGSHKEEDLTPDEEELLSKSAYFEDFVLTFTDNCLSLLENSSREQIRSEDADVMEETMNEEEIAADAAITDTFQKIASRSSPQIFRLVLSKLTRYVDNKILEPAVAGAIFSSTVKAAASVQPDQTLDFFVPHLVARIESRLADRQQGSKVADNEFQFALLMLSEVVSIKALGVTPRPCKALMSHMDKICHVLDLTLGLQQKDEYELATQLLENIFYNLAHVRPLQKLISHEDDQVKWSREEFRWGQSASLDNLKVDWYVPAKPELDTIHRLLNKYLQKPMDELLMWTRSKVDLEKEDVLRHLRQVNKVLRGCSELLPMLQTAPFKGSQKYSLKLMDELALTLNGKHVRQTVVEALHQVLTYVMSTCPDDTDSLSAIVAIYEVLLFSFGLDEEELNDHIEEHRTMKVHRLNKMVGCKQHLLSIQVDRVSLQHETHVWLKNFLTMETLPEQVVSDIFNLSVSRYSDVRALAQDLLLKIGTRACPDSHSLIVPKIVECLQDSPGISHQQLKGALYLICGEKYGFFYNWDNANKILPALVRAQHSDKPSVVELLKDLTVKSNRTYTEFALYSLPVRPAIIPACLQSKLTGMEVEDNDIVPDQMMTMENPQYLELELTLCRLVQEGNLHWRHSQMAIGMLLTIMLPHHVPPEPVVRMWLDCMLHDDRTIRLIAFQALECVIKLCKVKRKRHLTTIQDDQARVQPGARPANEWMQYRPPDMTDQQLETYWSQPFSVKPEMGFYAWEQPQVKLRVPDDTQLTQPGHVRDQFMAFFTDDAKLAKYIALNAVEHKKGEDFFSMDKALFYSVLFEQFGCDLLLPKFMPHLERLVQSTEESEQRVAAEIVYGLIRGSRFWSFEPTKTMWAALVPLFKTVLANMTAETIGDWETCISGASNKADPNRLRWLFELLLTEKDQLMVDQAGAFKESSHLRLLNRALVQNWKVRDLYNRSYEILRRHHAHPYNKVRNQIAKMLATLLSVDIDFRFGNWNMGQGFPRKKAFVSEILPKLNLNFHNPELNGFAVQKHNNGSEENCDDNNAVTPLDKESAHSLQTVAVWVSQFIQISSASITSEFYELLPFFCQFVGTETTDHETSQSCLTALCFLSVCIVHTSIIPKALDMVWKVAQSSSWKAKISILEFLQTFVFTNFMSLCLHPPVVSQIEDLIVGLMSDETVQVRQKAHKILCGMMHSNFLDKAAQQRLLKTFRDKIRAKMARKGSKKRFQKPPKLTDKGQLAEFHSGVLGLSALVEAYPYDVPEFIPDILVELEKHLHDPQPIPKTIKNTFQEFKRTHQDNWAEHKLKFTEDQLTVMTDLLVSPNYYA